MMQGLMPWMPVPAARGGAARTARGLSAHARGHAAERAVAEAYEDRGAMILERCWRSPAGEVDLIVREGETIVFVEVKQAETHDVAATRLSRRQMDRICQAACEYCGLSADMRFDAALVDDRGRVELLHNAFGAD